MKTSFGYAKRPELPRAPAIGSAWPIQIAAQNSKKDADRRGPSFSVVENTERLVGLKSLLDGLGLQPAKHGTRREINRLSWSRLLDDGFA